MMTEVPKFKGWAIVELMGHVRMAGLVEETTLAGAGMLQVEVPEVTDSRGNTHAGFTQFVSPSSLYRMTPTTEEIARGIALRDRYAPVNPWELPERTALPAGTSDDDDFSDVVSAEEREKFDGLGVE